MSHKLGPLGHREDAPLRDMQVFREKIKRHVDKLLELEARTHPARPHDTPPTDSKELDSLGALMHAEALMGLLVGWAWDHRIGTVVNNVAGFPWPEGDETAKEAADADDNELVGVAYRNSLGIRGIKGPGNSRLNRRILAELTSRHCQTKSA